MGGVKEIGVIVSCDKCRKDVMVDDPSYLAFYKHHSKREDASRGMFISLTMDVASIGNEIKTAYEWLCPMCVEAISEALRGKAPQIEEEGAGASAVIAVPKRRGRPPKITATVTVTKAAAAPVAAEPEAEIPDRDQGPGIEPPARSEESSVDDNELFD